MSEQRYRDIIATIPSRAQCSANHQADVIDAAQLTNHERGELWRYGVRQGYLTPLMLWEPSTSPAAKGRHVRQYRRTTTPIRGAA